LQFLTRRYEQLVQRCKIKETKYKFSDVIRLEHSFTKDKYEYFTTLQFDVFLAVHHSIDFFQITNLMHNSFIL